jgi:hypothetical protein
MRGAVMTCPQRAQAWPQVRAWWPGWDLHVDPGVGVVENFALTLERACDIAETEGQPWALLVQDDVEPCTGLAEDAGTLLALAPTDAVAVSGFSTAPSDVALCARGERWRRKRWRSLLWVMFLAVRVDLAREAAAGVRAGAGPHDDQRLSRWLDATKHPAYTHVPSVVQHRGVESVLGHRWLAFGRPRVSPTFRDGVSLPDLVRAP